MDHGAIGEGRVGHWLSIGWGLQGAWNGFSRI